jgi:hypothetical protein
VSAQATTSTGYAVFAEPDTLTVSGFPSPDVAGVSHTVTVTATDGHGGTDTDYAGTVHFTSSDSAAGLPGDYAFTNVDAGTHTFSLSLLTTGSQSLTATDTGNAAITGTQAGIAVGAVTAGTKPTGVTATAGNASAVVSWTAPADNGGSTITGYTVTSAPDSKTCTWTIGPLSCTVSGLVNHTPYTFTVHATSSVGDGDESDSSDAVTPRVGDTYVPLPPARIVNSAAALGLTGKIKPFVGVSFQVTGFGGVAANATAVTGVITVLNATGSGYLSVTPEIVNKPTTSSINFPKGDSRSAGMTVTLGAGGKLSVTYGGGAGTSVDIYFDVTGYFVVGSSGATYNKVTPNRLVDSRKNNGISGKITAGTAKSFTVVDRTPGVVSTNVPDDAIAVTGILTITDQNASGHLTLSPAEDDAPSTASIYSPKGDIRATGLTMMLDPDGLLWVTFVSSTAGATTSVVFDVTGYFAAGPGGAMYVPVTPNRLVDTRFKVGISSKLLTGQARTFQVTNRVTKDLTRNIPTAAIAVTGTLTETNATSAGYMSLTTVATNKPGTSTMNFPKGDIRATGVTVPLGAGGKLSVTAMLGRGANTQVVFDVSGYFVN